MPKQTNFIREEIVVAANNYLRSKLQQHYNAEQLAKQIKRHCDDIESVEIKTIEENICEFCGYGWTEDSAEYNGGCCDKDQDMHEQTTLAKRLTA